MNGANTKRPHMPYIMLGTAASNSMAPPISRLAHAGASSTRNSAITKPKGTAAVIAMIVETSVP